MHFHFVIVFMSFVLVLPLGRADEAAASRPRLLLQQDFFSLSQKPNHAKRCFSVLKSTCLSRLLLPHQLLPLPTEEVLSTAPPCHTAPAGTHSGQYVCDNCPQADSSESSSLALCLDAASSGSLHWPPKAGASLVTVPSARTYYHKFSNGSLFQACELHESSSSPSPLHLELRGPGHGCLHIAVGP